MCHFELPHAKTSDGANKTGGFSEGRAGTPLEKGSKDAASAYQVLEFDSLGVMVKNTKRFFVLNPTSEALEFLWQQVGQRVVSWP